VIKTNRGASKTQTLPVALFLPPDEKLESGDVAGMFCARGLTIRTIPFKNQMSYTFPCTATTSRQQQVQPDVLHTPQLPGDAVLQKAEIEELMQELELVSSHDTNLAKPDEKPVPDGLSDIDTTTPSSIHESDE
jgi:hypothetical protein